MSNLVKTSCRFAVALAIILITLLIGVAQAQHDQVGTEETEQLTVVIAANPETLDPTATLDYITFDITTHIFEQLVAADDANLFKPGPGLADSWTVSPDGLTWTFNIRPGAKFHDGTDADAAAVVYNINSWWDPDHPHYAEDFLYFEYLFGQPKGEDGSAFVEVKAVNASKVTIQLDAPDSNILAKFSFPTFAIASPQAIAAGTLDINPVGSGPYKFVAWQANQYVELAVNDQWKMKPEMEQLLFKVIPEPADKLAALKSGQAQASNELEFFLAEVQEAGNLRVAWHPANNVGYLGINRAHTPLDNLLVRRAIAHAVNRQALVADHYSPGDQVAKDLVPPQLWGADPELEDYAYDPALAVDLLKQAGYPNGFEITLSFRDVFRGYLPDPEATAAGIAADLQAVGIMATVEELEQSEFVNRLYAGELELFLLGWTTDYPHPYNVYTFVLCRDVLGPNDDEICDTLDLTLEATSLSEEEALFHNVSKRVHETVQVLPLAHNRYPLVIYRDLFHVSYFWGNRADFTTAIYADSHSYLPVTTKE